VNNREINIATIDTILTFYLAFLYTDMHYYDKDRLLCMAKFLFDVQHKNRLEQRGLLRRFTVKCYGKQDTIEDMRETKARKYKELRKEKGTREYEMWFLKYAPSSYRGTKKPKNKTMKRLKTNSKEPIETLKVIEEKKESELENKLEESSPGVTSFFGLFGKNKKRENKKRENKKRDFLL
jgi:hypothetical protein